MFRIMRYFSCYDWHKHVTISLEFEKVDFKNIEYYWIDI